MREEDDKMTWQEELKKSITNIDQLAEILHLSNEQKEQYEAVIERFPMMITPYYLSLVDTNNPHDPIGKMCIPSLDEFNQEGSFDTSGEATNTKMDGLQRSLADNSFAFNESMCYVLSPLF